jgi:hypothetical protein
VADARVLAKEILLLPDSASGLHGKIGVREHVSVRTSLLGCALCGYEAAPMPSGTGRATLGADRLCRVAAVLYRREAGGRIRDHALVAACRGAMGRGGAAGRQGVVAGWSVRSWSAGSVLGGSR